jgi:predicted nucleotidyltransferase
MPAPTLQLEPKHLSTVQEILAKHLPHYRIWAFGSRVKHTAKPYSDLDLAIIGDKPLGLMTLATLEQAFSESDLPFRVDLIDWATTQEHFRKIIQEHYTILQ